jgi:hypothetical protein
VQSAQETLTYNGEEFNTTAGPFPYTTTGATPTLDSADWYNVTLEARKTVARSLNVLDSDVTYDTPGEIVSKYIYSASQQLTYSVPAGAIGKTISSVVGNVLNTVEVGGPYELLGVNKSGVEFNTIADIDNLQSVGGKISSLLIGDSVVALDYATGNNSGILFFKVVPDTGQVDDGGKRIYLPTLGAWIEQNMKLMASPKDYGAVGDGVADDTVPIQKVVDALNPFGGEGVSILSGAGERYAITSPIIVKSTNVTIENINLFAIAGFAAGEPLIRCDWSYVAIKGCGLFCSRIADGVRFNGDFALGCQVIDSRIDRPLNRGVAYDRGGHDHVVSRCLFTNNDPTQKTSYGVYGNTGDITVTDNTFQQMEISAYFRYGGVIFTGNHLYQGKGDGTDEDTPMTAGFITDRGDCVVNSNYFDKCSLVMRVNQHAIDGIRNVNICNNLFFTKATYATADAFIEFRAGTAATPTGNNVGEVTIKDNSYTNSRNATPSLYNYLKNETAGTLEFTKMLAYDNSGDGVGMRSTRQHKLIEIPASSTSVTADISDFSDQFGGFSFLLCHLVNNAGNRTFNTTQVATSLGRFTFDISSTHTQPLYIAAEVRSTSEF